MKKWLIGASLFTVLGVAAVGQFSGKTTSTPDGEPVTESETVTVPHEETPARTGFPFGQRVRVVDATGWIVEGQLEAAIPGWVRVTNDAGREVFVSTSEATLIEVIDEQAEEATSFVSLETPDVPKTATE